MNYIPVLGVPLTLTDIHLSMTLHQKPYFTLKMRIMCLVEHSSNCIIPSHRTTYRPRCAFNPMAKTNFKRISMQERREKMEEGEMYTILWKIFKGPWCKKPTSSQRSKKVSFLNSVALNSHRPKVLFQTINSVITSPSGQPVKTSTKKMWTISSPLPSIKLCCGGHHDHHSTETSLSKVYHDLLPAVDSEVCVILILLNLSSAFHTVDHGILSHHLERFVVIKDMALALE